VICPITRVLDVPVLETERLRLRGHAIEDFANTVALWGDDAVTKYIGGKPFTVEECWARFLRYAGHWSVLGFGFWVVEEKATGDFVGEVGFGNYKREMDPPLGSAPEVGWVLTPAKHGKGYATEAVNAALAWGRSHFRSSEFVCIIHPEHKASINVATKCGFEARAHGIYKDRPAIIFKLGWSDTLP
jgi:RimJ/RimL family protein N-acetyltransferase